MTVPEALRDLPQWVCWGKPDLALKCPVNPHTGKAAKANDKSTWTALLLAEAAMELFHCKGVGFEFAAGGGIVGVDFDHCIHDSALDPWAEEWVRRFDSFTEVSQSGTGLHIYCKGKLSGDGVKRPEAEMYDQGRYFAFTGNVWGEEKPVREAQDAIDALYAELSAEGHRAAQRPSEPPTLPALPPTGNDYLSIGLERDARFAALWRGERPNGNESADDIGLMDKLAYWLNRDPDAMRAAFLASPHCQTKDEAHTKKTTVRADYLTRTIERSLTDCTDTAQERDAEYAARYQSGAPGDSPLPDGGNGFAPFEPFEQSGAAELPDFPLDALPPVLRDYAAAIAEDKQVPVDMPAVALLGVASLAVQGLFTITIKGGWAEPLNLYTCIVAKPSEKKSPVFKEAMRCVYRFEAEENERRAPAICEYQTKKRILEKRLTNLTDKASKSTKGHGDKAEAEALMNEQAAFDTQRELDELVPVHSLRLVADDTTLEALTSLLANNDGRMCLASAEGGIFNVLAGLYSGGKDANIDPVLKAYTGEQIMVDRKGRASEFIESPALTLLLMVQPEVLHKIMENNQFRGRGLLARFFYSMPRSMVGKRRYKTTPVPQEVYEAFRARIVGLLQMKADGAIGGTITLDEDADALSESFHYRLENRLPDELEDIGDWAGKLHGQIMRVAGIFHCMETGEDADAEPMRAATVQNAIHIGEYFLAHAANAFRTMGASEKPETRDAKYILKRLQGTGKTEISKRDLHQMCRGRFATAELFEPGLRELARRGYIRIDKPTTNQRGRPTENIIVNDILNSQ